MPTKLAGLNLDKNILSAVRSEGCESPIPIQAQAIPSVLKGRDIIAPARIGSGKAAVLLLSTLQWLTKRSEKPSRGPRALTLALACESAV